MSQPNLEAMLQRIVDRDAIAQAIALHARGIDRSDADLVNAAYHPGSEVAYGFFDGPAAEFADILGANPDSDPMSLHRPSNVWIEIDGDRAKSESYIFAFVPGGEDDGFVQSIFGGRYLDRHEKRDGEWRLVHRTYVLDWNVGWQPTGTADPNFDASMFNRGAKRGNDMGTRMLEAWQQEMGGAAAKGAGMNDELIARAEEALAKQDIHNLIMAQARASDRGDKALLHSVWHPDATVNVGVFEGPADEYSDMIVDFSADRPAMSHNVANEWIVVSGDKAISESYVIAFSQVPNGDTYTDDFVGGRYLDRFEKRDGVWKATHRTFVMDWITSHPTSDQGEDGMLAALKTRGTRGSDDPIYDFWNS